MANGEYYRIQIDSIVLSSDGANTGVKCRLEVEGLKNILRSYAGVSITSEDGGSVDQITAWTAGKDFAIKIQKTPLSVWEDLKTLFDTSATTGTDFEVIATGSPGDFTVDAKTFVNDPYEFERFDTNFIYNLIIRMRTT